MRHTIGLKARIDDRNDLIARVEELSDSGRVEITQSDTFFDCPQGTLKLRTRDEQEGRLMVHTPAPASEPGLSTYASTPTAEAATLRETLSLAYGVLGRVRIDRMLYVHDDTRIHLDRIEEVGDFIELEITLNDGESADIALRRAHGLMRRLGVGDSRLVDGTYLDISQAV